ncbi:MAG: alpha/beta hydrolase [Acidobacteria bacterium]|nr:alpha/beta hydrolase [Acidobacteriota bacterium]
MRHDLKKLLSIGAVCAVMAFPCRAQAQDNKPQTVPYGANPAAGHYLRVGDASIYYETYGSGGTPLVLLHGAVYGYIDEFSQLIEQLSQHRRVIAIATRGHGRSEIGTSPFSYSLFASDAYAVIHHESSGKVDVLGFSGGAITAYTLAAAHPELVRRLVAIGGPRRFTDRSLDAQAESKRAKASDVERDMPQFVADRKKLMPQPERWEEFVAKMNALDLGPVFVTDAQIRSIQPPALLIAGDHDPYNDTTKFVDTYRLLPHGELAVIPGCGHVVLDCKGPFTIRAAEEFLDRKDGER